MSKAIDFFYAGQLDEALEQAAQDVRSRPTDLRLRSLFCELLCFSRDWERADKQLDAIIKIDQTALVGVSMIRHLIRSEVSRTEVYEQGRVPEFIDKPSAVLEKRLKALTHFRAGEMQETMASIAEAIEVEKPLTGLCNGESFEEIRDMDDLLGTIVEVFTATGVYYWLSLDQIETLEFDQPVNLVDQLWRAARIETVGDLKGRVYIPVLYYGSQESEDGRVRVGRATDWVENDGGPVTGRGQREFLIGNDAMTVLQIRNLSISESP